MNKLFSQAGFFFLICTIIITLTGCNLFLQIMEGLNQDDDESTKKLNPLPDSTADGAMVIDSGFSDSNQTVHYGMSYGYYYGEQIYLTSWYHNSITCIDIITNRIVTGFPKYLNNVNKPHGLAVDDYYGNFWVCDLNNHALRIYDYNFNQIDEVYLGETSEPVNAISDGNYIYVADRSDNSIWRFDANYPQNPLHNNSITDFSNSGYSDYIDMDIYEGYLCIVSESLAGIVMVDSYLTYIQTININDVPHLGAVGIYISYNDSSFYLNTGDHIYITEGFSGYKRSDWPIMPPEGYYGDYIDIEVAESISKLYVASWNGNNSDIGAHILEYTYIGPPMLK